MTLSTNPAVSAFHQSLIAAGELLPAPRVNDLNQAAQARRLERLTGLALLARRGDPSLQVGDGLTVAQIYAGLDAHYGLAAAGLFHFGDLWEYLQEAAIIAELRFEAKQALAELFPDKTVPESWLAPVNLDTVKRNGKLEKTSQKSYDRWVRRAIAIVQKDAPWRAALPPTAFTVGYRIGPEPRDPPPILES